MGLKNTWVNGFTEKYII